MTTAITIPPNCLLVKGSNLEKIYPLTDFLRAFPSYHDLAPLYNKDIFFAHNIKIIGTDYLTLHLGHEYILFQSWIDILTAGIQAQAAALDGTSAATIIDQLEALYS